MTIWRSPMTSRYRRLGRGERLRVGADPVALVERADGAHLLVVELEAEDVEVLGDSLGRHRLRDHDVAELEVPADHHLTRGLAVPLRDLDDRGVVEHLALRQRAPRLGGDAEL